MVMYKILYTFWISVLVWMPVIAEEQAVKVTKDLHIGVQARYSPYSSQGDGQIEGILVEATRAVCRQIGRTCVFHQNALFESLQALRNRQLDAVVVAEQFIADVHAKGLFFLPPICKVKPVYIWGERVQPVIQDATFMRKEIGVLADSHLEFYLQNTLPLNVHVIPYALLENAAFDLLNKKIDMLFTSQAFFQRKANSVFLEGVEYNLPTTAAYLEDYQQPAHSMTLVMRQGSTLLKEALVKVMQKREVDYCFKLLPEKFIRQAQ